jgi:hypothetical protein
MAGSARRSLFASLKVLRMGDDDGDEIGLAERATLPSRLHGGSLERDRCAERGCPAPVLRNRRLAFRFVSSSTPRRIPSRSGMRGASKRSAPTTPRGSKAAAPTS